MKLRFRTLVAGLLGLGVAFLAVAGGGPQQADLHEIADLRLFDPGNIISDGVFYDPSTMTVGGIQAFLEAKGANCTGVRCLKTFRQDTWSRAADTRCNGYTGAAGESAATIIRKVGVACGINPRALLVILQKEQGLITSRGPSEYGIERAMGFGCPDTSVCDAQYFGLYNQLYSAARQFKNYRATPARYGYRAGLTNYIGYAPATKAYDNIGSQRCGLASVYIQNQATAGLYNYTPYVPNKAALAAGYGTGDSCSAYGNRNFFQYFTDWFGSTQSSGGAAVLDKNTELATAGIQLGAPTSEVSCSLPYGGCSRDYAGGTIYWHQNTGSHVVRGAILNRYRALGGPAVLGYPVGDDTAAPWNSGWYTDFQGGAIYWSAATGAHEVRGAILAAWRKAGAQAGVLGYPVAGDEAVPGGYRTRFAGGSVYWSAGTGARTIRGALLQKYDAAGGPAALGFPVMDARATATGNGAYVDLTGGSIYWSASSGAHVVRGALLSMWRELGAQAGPMGFPTSDDEAVPGGYKTDFQRGGLYWSAATGAKGVRGALQAKYEALGGPAVLGFPLAHDGPTSSGGGAMVRLQRGDIVWSASTGAHVVRGALLSMWRELGAQAGPMGFPTGDVKTVPGGYKTDFQRGGIYWSKATGAKGVRGALHAKYEALGGPAALGFPVAHDGATSSGGGALVRLQAGEIIWSQAGGAHVVRGAILSMWRELGAQAGPMGFPTGDDEAVPGGYKTDFQRGGIYWSAATGAKGVRGALHAKYEALGGPAALGFPVAHDGATSSGGGALVRLQRGDIVWSASTGAHDLRGGILTRWRELGAQAGVLGFPTGDHTAVPGGSRSDFRGGTVYWSSATGARVVRGAAVASYAAMGATASPLGFPVSDTKAVSGGRRTDFQAGYLLEAADGTVTVGTTS